MVPESVQAEDTTLEDTAPASTGLIAGVATLVNENITGIPATLLRNTVPENSILTSGPRVIPEPPIRHTPAPDTHDRFQFRPTESSNTQDRFQFHHTHQNPPSNATDRSQARPTARVQFRPTDSNIRTTPVIESQFRFRPELLSYPVASYRTISSAFPPHMEHHDPNGFREHQVPLHDLKVLYSSSEKPDPHHLREARNSLRNERRFQRPSSNLVNNLHFLLRRLLIWPDRISPHLWPSQKNQRNLVVKKKKMWTSS